MGNTCKNQKFNIQNYKKNYCGKTDPIIEKIFKKEIFKNFSKVKFGNNLTFKKQNLFLEVNKNYPFYVIHRENKYKMFIWLTANLKISFNIKDKIGTNCFVNNLRDFLNEYEDSLYLYKKNEVNTTLYHFLKCVTLIGNGEYCLFPDGTYYTQ
jgi:hypothetical protein